MRYSVLLVLILMVGCATISESLRKDIDDGDFEVAIFDADVWLKKEKNKTDSQRGQVELLLEEATFRQSRRLDTPEAYRDFLERFKSSKFRGEATDHLARTHFETYTRKADTLEGYQQYLVEFPSGEYPDRARERAARLVFREVEKKGTLEGYRAFRTEFHMSPLASIALAKEISMAWAAVEKTQNWKALLAFAKMYPDCAWSEIARGMAHKMGWAEAERVGVSAAYRRFRLAFPDSALRSECYARELELAWRETEAADSEEAYRDFYTLYPDAPQAPLAEQREKDWAYFNSPVDSEVPRTTVNQINDRDMNSVWLYADVRDGKGRLVSGLRQEDFTVFENGRRAEIRGFLGMDSNRPVDVVMLIDLSGSMSDKIEAVKTSAIDFADTLRARQRDVALGLVAFIETASAPFGGGRLTTDARTFQGWVASLGTGQGSRENPIQAVFRANSYKFRPGAQRVYILLTDEAPEWPVDPLSRMTISDVAQSMAQQDVTFYSVTPDNEQYRQMVGVTRGVLFDMETVNRQGAFTDVMGHIGTLLSKQYRIAYASPRGVPSGESRDIRVRARLQDVWVEAGQLEGEVAALLPVEGVPCGMLAVVQDRGIAVSKDCGATWTALPLPELATRFVQVVGGWGDGLTLFLLTADGRLLAVGDGETKVRPLATGLGAVRLLAWDRARPDYLLIMAGDRFYSSDDSGSAFAEFRGPQAADVRWLALDPHAQTHVCVVSPSQGIICSLDGGINWEVVAPVSGLGELTENSRLSFCPYRANLVFLSDGAGRMYRSLDGGRNWAGVYLASGGSPVGSFGQILYPEGAVPMVCQVTTEGLFCSDDNGLSWRKTVDGLGWGTGGLPALTQVGNGRLVLGGRGDGRIFQLYEVANRELVASSIFFDSGSYKPKESLVPLLRDVAGTLQSDASLQARVEGHTDSDGPDDSNMDLSQRRAEAVRLYLAYFGANGDQIITAGYGETRPLVPNTSDTNKQKNRRVEILLIRGAEAAQ